MQTASPTRPSPTPRALARRARGLVPLLALAAALALVAFVLTRIDGGPDDAAAPAARSPETPPALTGGAPGDSSRAPARDVRELRVPEAAQGEHAGAVAAEARPPGARTEREFLDELAALARQDPAAFTARAEAVLSGSGPAPEQLAVLRTAYEAGRPDAPGLFARAAATLPDTSGPHGESVPMATVLWLRARAAREPLARAALAEIVWSEQWVAASALRSRAVRELALATPESDLPALRARVAGSHDRAVLEAGLAALDERAQPAPAPALPD